MVMVNSACIGTLIVLFVNLSIDKEIASLLCVIFTLSPAINEDSVPLVSLFKAIFHRLLQGCLSE